MLLIKQDSLPAFDIGSKFLLDPLYLYFTFSNFLETFDSDKLHFIYFIFYFSNDTLRFDDSYWSSVLCSSSQLIMGSIGLPISFSPFLFLIIIEISIAIIILEEFFEF